MAWNRQDFTINKARIIDVEDKSVFCEKRKQFIIFPVRQSFSRSEDLCDIHGAKLAVPSSEEEEQTILDIVSKHEALCLGSSNNIQEGKAVWLGMERWDRKWHISDGNNDRQQINYTNWDPNKCTDEVCGGQNYGCPYIQKDSLWAFGLTEGSCSTLELCSVCSYTETPVFTLKGKCREDGQLNWNYYLVVNESNQISAYDGYKTSKLQESDGVWTLKDSGVSAHGVFDSPLGRKQWDYIDKTCSMASPVNTSLTISKCDFGEEFTCDSGQCVAMLKRCNSINDCKDGSDEEYCNLVKIPTNYDKISPPRPLEPNNSVDLITRINIVSVDVIDTYKMLIGITFDFEVKWIDARLNFQNLDSSEENFISIEAAEKLWLPYKHIVHDNAILGEIRTIEGHIGVRNLTEPKPGSTMKSVENYVYNVEETQIFLKKRFKIIYSCIFELSKFPFDEHECNFTMKLDATKRKSIQFAEDMPSVVYSAHETIGQFKIFNFTSHIVNDVKSTHFIFTLKIRRLVMNQMLSTFLPTALLWALGYATLFIDIENSSDRFIGTVTALLVLVSLLSSVNGDLPKTSYFKFIDLWFLWYISNILLIIIFHIFLNHIPNNQIKDYHNVSITISENGEEKTLRAKVNMLASVVFAATTVLFVIVYFNITT